MPEPADSLSLAVAAERPNIFIAPDSGGDDARSGCAHADAASVVAVSDGRAEQTASPHLAPSVARAARLVEAGLPVSSSVVLAAAVAAVLAFLVLHEIGHDGVAGTRDVGKTTPSPVDTWAKPAHRRPRVARSEPRTSTADRHRRAQRRGSRSRRTGARGTCCRRRRASQRARSASASRRPRAIAPTPSPFATPASPPAAVREHNSPAPVPTGAPPEFM